MLKTGKLVFAIFRRDLLLYRRKQSEWLMPFVFFMMIISLFPLGLDPAPTLLKAIAPGILWIAVVLALLTSTENRYRTDFEEGFIEELILSPCPLPILLLSKSLAHWIIFGIPMLLLIPVVGILFNLSMETLLAFGLTLFLGIPTLSLLSSLGVTLTLSLPRGGLYLTILLFPLVMPLVVFGSGSLFKATQGISYTAELLLLSALFIMALILVPIMTAYILKMSVE